MLQVATATSKRRSKHTKVCIRTYSDLSKITVSAVTLIVGYNVISQCYDTIGWVSGFSKGICPVKNIALQQYPETV